MSYRIEDNILILQTAIELAARHKEHLYMCFVDLQKAYDKIPRGNLFNVLLNELQVSESNLKCLMRMYSEIRAAVCVEGKYAEDFAMHEGVRQGCPASPLVFSLYMDRLEQFLESEMLSNMNGTAKRALRIAGILLPGLLFADDIVFTARSLEALQRTMETLSDFCRQNSLTVSLKKTEWLIGGKGTKGFRAEVDIEEDALLYYRGTPLKRVQEFKYLGLMLTGRRDKTLMVQTRITKAKAAWGGLQGKLNSLGWRDRSTKLALFEAYVRSVLLYGSAIWGTDKLDAKARIGVDCTGEMGTFYRSCLRSLLGVSYMTRNTILYVVAGKPPLQVYIAKSVR